VDVLKNNRKPLQEMQKRLGYRKSGSVENEQREREERLGEQKE
jgi:hypothetical protein